MTKEDFIETIIQLRHALNLTQLDVAFRAGCSVKTVSRFETGHNIKSNYLINILFAVGFLVSNSSNNII